MLKCLGMKKPIIGRPPVEGEKRSKLVAFYLTETDHRKLKKLAEEGGFRSTSNLLTAVNEPIIQGGFALATGVKTLSTVQRFMEANGVKFEASWADVRDGMLKLFTPPPPTLDPQLLDISQLKQDLRDLLDELENQTKTQKQKHDYANR
jgi:hypothetical protein